MAEDFDVEAMLEAPYNAPVTNGTSRDHRDDHKSAVDDDER